MDERNSRPVYLDYQATTPIDPGVRKTMIPFLNELFGSPDSKHTFGYEPAQTIENARKQVAAFIKAKNHEIVFTSGATESCNLALRGVAHRVPKGRNRIVTLATEHAAVLETAHDLGNSRFNTVVLPVNGDGLVNLDILDEVLDENTLIVSVMAVNNEIGVIQPIAEIGKRCRAAGILFHTDATQAAGRMNIDVKEWNVDLMSLSGHKVYGPKGVGVLFVRSGVKIDPIFTGGPQENGRRAGTPAPALIAGLGQACEIASRRHNEDVARIATLTRRLYEGLVEVCPDLHLFGHREQRVAGNLNIGLPGVSSEEVIMNSARDIAVSSGSACSSASTEPSRVLLALGLEPETAATGIRISLGRFSTKADVDTAIKTLAKHARMRH